MKNKKPDLKASLPQDWEHLYVSFAMSDKERPRLDEVLSVMIEIEEEPGHVAQVAILAHTLFEETSHLHSLGQEEKFWLVAAALLHDVGWALTPDGSKHHKYSLQYILEYPWTCFSAREKSIIANVARYHRKALPDESHPHFHPLGKKDKKTVETLSSLLRLADALDRTHLQIVRDVKLIFKKDEIHLMINAQSPPEAELNAIERKKDLFELVFKSKLQSDTF